MDIGAIFCHVSRIIPDMSVIPCVTSGTQKWNGDRPSFIVRAVVITVSYTHLTLPTRDLV